MTAEMIDKPRVRKLNVDLTDAQMMQFKAVANLQLMSREELLAKLIDNAIRAYSSKFTPDPGKEG